MFGKKNSNNIEKKIYENEIKRLTQERNNFATKYEIADRYRNEYEYLKKDYENKLEELDSLKKKVNKLTQELEFYLTEIKKNNR